MIMPHSHEHLTSLEECKRCSIAVGETSKTKQRKAYYRGYKQALMDAIELCRSSQQYSCEDELEQIKNDLIEDRIGGGKEDDDA